MLKRFTLLTTFIFAIAVGSAWAQATIVQATPSYANPGQSLDVTITGAATHFTSGSSTNTVRLFKQGSATINALYSNASSTTVLTAHFNIPTTAIEGNYDVQVYDPIDGSVALARGFLIKTAAILNVNPSQGNLGQTLDVTITGLATTFKQGSASISLFKGASNTIDASNIKIINNSTIIGTFSIPATAALGKWSIKMYNNGYSLNKDTVFTIVNPAAIASITIPKVNANFYPNPFNGNAILVYDVTQQDMVEISLYNVLGQRLKTLVNTTQATGHYELPITDKEIAAKGIFFISVKIGNENPQLLKAVRE